MGERDDSLPRETGNSTYFFPSSTVPVPREILPFHAKDAPLQSMPVVVSQRWLGRGRTTGNNYAPWQSREGGKEASSYNYLVSPSVCCARGPRQTRKIGEWGVNALWADRVASNMLEGSTVEERNVQSHHTAHIPYLSFRSAQQYAARLAPDIPQSLLVLHLRLPPRPNGRRGGKTKRPRPRARARPLPHLGTHRGEPALRRPAGNCLSGCATFRVREEARENASHISSLGGKEMNGDRIALSRRVCNRR